MRERQAAHVYEILNFHLYSCTRILIENHTLFWAKFQRFKAVWVWFSVSLVFLSPSLIAQRKADICRVRFPAWAHPFRPNVRLLHNKISLKRSWVIGEESMTNHNLLAQTLTLALEIPTSCLYLISHTHLLI